MATAKGFSLRKASSADVQGIYAVLRPFVEENILLPRDISQIEQDISLTWVAESSASEIIGTVNLTCYSAKLYEVRGLAVALDFQQKNIGRALVIEALQWLSLHTNKGETLAFALTYSAPFFLSLGFSEVDKKKFPAKIYDVCRFCAKQDDCKETAVQLKLQNFKGVHHEL